MEKLTHTVPGVFVYGHTAGRNSLAPRGIFRRGGRKNWAPLCHPPLPAPTGEMRNSRMPQPGSGVFGEAISSDGGRFEGGRSSDSPQDSRERYFAALSGGPAGPSIQDRLEQTSSDVRSAPTAAWVAEWKGRIPNEQSEQTPPLQMGAEQLDPEMLAYIDTAYNTAQMRLSQAQYTKAQDVNRFRQHLASSTLADATELQQWASQLARDDTVLDKASSVAERTDVAWRRANQAHKLHEAAVSKQVQLQRQAVLLHAAQKRFDEVNSSAKSAEAAAAQARTKLADVLSGGEAFTVDSDLIADIERDAQPDSLSSPVDAPARAHVPDSQRTFYSLLYSPRTMSLGENAEVRGPSGTLYRSTSIFCLLPGHAPRSWAILLCESKFFDPFILLTIMANCATMAWQSPLDPCCTPKADFIDVCEWVFLAIFTCEMLTKILAYGFAMHKGSYLRDAWCIMDFVVVSLAWLPILFPTMGNYSALRAVRALRPLRALKRLPGMPLLIQLIMDVIPKLSTVMLLCGFIFLVFGIVGMEVFKGGMHYRCALPNSDAGRMLWGASSPPPVSGSSSALSPSFLSSASASLIDTGITCSPDHPVRCELDVPGSTCEFFDVNPHNGIESFDSIPFTFVLLFQCITFDEWATVMYDVMANSSAWACIFFLLIVIFGGFFVVNLFLAVVFLEFESAKAKIDAEKTPAPTSCSSAGSGNVESDDQRALLDHSQMRSDGSGATAKPQGCLSFCDCTPQRGTCRSGLSRFVTSDSMSNAATGLVLMNTVVMCMPYEGMPDEYASKLELASSVITWCFIVEMAFKLVGLGCSAYWDDNWNKLDGSIVIMSIVEIVAAALASGSGVKLSFLRTLRMLRVARMLRLMKSWKGLYKVISTFIKALPQMSNIGILLLLTSFIFALLGMTLFGGIYTPENGYSLPNPDDPCPDGICADGLLMKPRSHFDYCYPAMISIFVILTGEWVGVMTPVTAIVGPYASIFFIIAVIIGNYLLINLLVAVILSEFGDEDGDEEPTSQQRLEASSRPGLQQATPVAPAWEVTPMLKHAAGKDHNQLVRVDRRTINAIVKIDNVVQGEGALAAFQMDQVCGVGFQYIVPSGQHTGCHAWNLELFYTSFLDDTTQPDITCLFYDGTKVIRLSPSIDVTVVQYTRQYSMTEPLIVTGATDMPQWPVDYSLFVFNRRSWIRRACKWAIAQSWFLTLIMVAIAVSSVTLALDTPRVDPDSELAVLLKKADFFFTGFFFTEMMLKIVALGFFFAKDAYIKDSWNQLDFAIVFVSILVLLAEYIPELRGLRVLRILRVLRPLRVISRNPGLKLIITTLVRCMPAVANVFAVMLALQLVFAILGMQIFTGTMGACNDATLTTREECLTVEGNSWTNPPVGSFDSFMDAMRLLYVQSSGDEWQSPMYLMMDATTAGSAQVRNDSSSYALFSLVWMLIGNLFAQNLVVGVVVDDFSRRTRMESGAGILTAAQKQWVDAMQALRTRKPVRHVRPPRESGLRRKAYYLVTAPAFDAFIIVVIVANIMLMSCDYWEIEQNKAFYDFYEKATLVFTYIYYTECALKLTALSVHGYFSDPWCRFDFFLVCTSLFEQLAADILMQYFPLPPMLLRVLRVFRILRILRLLKGAKDLRNLIVTVVLSIPALANVACILALVIFVYGVLGVQLFTFLAHGDVIDDERNFHSIGPAMLLLFQCLTGDGWSTYMGDAGVTEASGNCSEEEGNCGSAAAIPFFISFQLVGCFIFLNLFVAVILENFTTLHNTDTNLVSSFDLETFNDAWARFDPDATNFIPSPQLAQLLLILPPPLGIKGVTESVANRMCMRLTLPQHMGMVEYSEVINELVNNNYFRSGPKSGINLDLKHEFNEDEFKGTAEVAGVAVDEVPKAAELSIGEFNSAHKRRFSTSASATELLIFQAVPTVAHCYALKKIDRSFTRAVLDRWRLRMLRKRTYELEAEIGGRLTLDQMLPTDIMQMPGEMISSPSNKEYTKGRQQPARAAPTPPARRASVGGVMFKLLSKSTPTVP